VVFNTNNTGHHVIHDILLKVVFNTNKTVRHVIQDNWHIVESDIQHQWWPVLLVLNTTSNNMSGITYNMMASFIGAECHFQQYVSYPV
jgi:hypothetical protein